MKTWEVIIYEGNGFYNWKAKEKYSNCKIPAFGKTFDSEIKAKKDFERYASLMGIENYEYVTEKEEENIDWKDLINETQKWLKNMKILKVRN